MDGLSISLDIEVCQSLANPKGLIHIRAARHTRHPRTASIIQSPSRSHLRTSNLDWTASSSSIPAVRPLQAALRRFRSPVRARVRFAPRSLSHTGAGGCSQGTYVTYSNSIADTACPADIAGRPIGQLSHRQSPTHRLA